MAVLLCHEIQTKNLQALFEPYGLIIQQVSEQEAIPGSFWKTPEAGLIGNKLYIRDDTPAHSALHEACHYICMDKYRRQQLDTNAGGDYEEENGVCYLQILLADTLDVMGRERMFRDMDEWGYSFRLGASRTWFEQDAEDARHWLVRHLLIENTGTPTWKLRIN